jgi:hypothetical protein
MPVLMQQHFRAGSDSVYETGVDARGLKKLKTDFIGGWIKRAMYTLTTDLKQQIEFSTLS